MDSALAAGAEPATEALHKPMTPPTSEEGDKHRPNTSHSELSDLNLDDLDDEGEIEPDHYYGDGKIPVFKPVCLSSFYTPPAQPH